MSKNTDGYYILSKNSSAPQPFHWVLKAPNHEVILTSENYTTKDDALNGIRSVRKNSLLDERYKRLTALDESPYFNLVAANGKVIGTSEMYSSKQMMEKGIMAVKKYAENAELQDNT